MGSFTGYYSVGGAVVRLFQEGFSPQMHGIFGRGAVELVEFFNGQCNAKHQQLLQQMAPDLDGFALPTCLERKSFTPLPIRSPPELCSIKWQEIGGPSIWEPFSKSKPASHRCIYGAIFEFHF